MLTFESRHNKRILGVLTRGEELLQSLRLVAERNRLRAAWIRGTGSVEWVDLTYFQPDRGGYAKPTRYEGFLHATTLEGSISMRHGELNVELSGTFVYADGTVQRVVAGPIARASVYAVEFFLEGFEDIRLERDEDERTGLGLWKGDDVSPGVLARAQATKASLAEHVPVGSSRVGRATRLSVVPEHADTEDMPPLSDRPADSRALSLTRASETASEPEASPGPDKKPSVAPSRFALVQAASANKPRNSDELPGRGDWVEHRLFGLCKIERLDDQGALIKLPTSVRKVIKLEIFEIGDPRYDGERRIFPLRPKK